MCVQGGHHCARFVAVRHYRRCIVNRGPIRGTEPAGQGVFQRRKQVTVSVGCYLNRGVAKALLDHQKMGPLGDHQRRRGVAQIVKSCSGVEV